MMDLTTLCLSMVVPFSLIFLSHEASATIDCRQCKPGYFASRLCSETHDTVCSPCGQGTYSSHFNRVQSCSKCSNCDVGEFVLRPCSLHSNTVCESCSSVIESKSDAFLRDCVQSDSSYSISQLSDETIRLKDNNHKTEEKNVDHNINIYEGSGVPEFEEKNIVHDSSEEIIEGSGEVHIEHASAATTNKTSQVPIVIIPDETYDKEEEIITKGTDSNITRTHTTDSSISTKPAQIITIKEGIVLIDSGKQLGNGTQEPYKTDDVLLKTDVTSTIASTVRSTTIKEVLIRPEEGIILQSKPSNVTKGFESESDEVIDVFIEENVPADEPQFGASKSKGQEESGGIGVGVFIAVIIICAAVFFVLGLMVNKYWGKRRARSFNVEQAEKQNGQTFPDRATIEFKDPEKNIPTKTGIYDEIPADKQNGTESHIKPATADPVYSKPVKRESSNMTNKANTESTGDADKLKADNEWGGMLVSRQSSSGSLIFSPAPELPANEKRNSRHSASIKYIDEDPTVEETDKLLPQQQPSQDEQIQPNTSNASNNNINENEEELATEMTPMISGDHDTVNV